jgi:hypothetical protein
MSDAYGQCTCTNGEDCTRSSGLEHAHADQHGHVLRRSTDSRSNNENLWRVRIEFTLTRLAQETEMEMEMEIAES